MLKSTAQTAALPTHSQGTQGRKNCTHEHNNNTTIIIQYIMNGLCFVEMKRLWVLSQITFLLPMMMEKVCQIEVNIFCLPQ